jgi:hypothetical protein
MAFAITNFANPFPAAMWDTGATDTSQKADVTNVAGTAQTAVDGGSASFSAMRAIVYVKTFGTLTTGDVFLFTVQAGTGASVTSPVNIIQKAVTVLSTDTAIVFEVFGISQVKFESYQVVVSTTGNRTCTYDYQIEIS